MKKTLSIILCIVPLWLLSQQVAFRVQVTTDTLYYGNPLKIKYTLENIQGDFEPPIFDGFDIVGGPNVSNQFSMINGDITQSSSYEYYLMPHQLGHLTIAEATVINDDGPLTSDIVHIVVVDNPNGIRQSHSRYMDERVTVRNNLKRPMSKSDSIKFKLSRLKSKRI